MKKLAYMLLSLTLTTSVFGQDSSDAPKVTPSPESMVTDTPPVASSNANPPSVSVPSNGGVQTQSTSPGQTKSSKGNSSASSSSSSSNTSQNAHLKINEKGKIQLDFINAEISDIAQSMGELTKRNFIIDDKVKGTITIISPKAVSIDEAYQAFISALEVKGFTVMRVGQVNKIVPLREMSKLPLPFDTDGAVGGGDAFITKLVPIQRSRSAEIAKAIRPFLTKNGDLISYDPTNTIIITDSVSNIRRVTSIIDKLDSAGFQESINVVKLQYAPVIDTADKIKKIMDLNGSGGNAPAGGEGGSAAIFQYASKVIPDERTNSLIIVSNAEGYQKILDIVKKIDQSIGNEIGSGRIHVHYLSYADATELATTLSGVSASASKVNSSLDKSKKTSASTPIVQPPVITSSGPATAGLLGGDVEIVADEQTNSLIITASSNDYQALIPVINKLDTRRPQAFVEGMILEVDVDRANSIGVSGNLGSTYGQSGEVSVFGATTFGTTSSIFLPTTTTDFQGLTTGFRSNTIDIPLGAGQFLTIPVFGGLFKALQTSGTVNVLSTPNILTRDNKEAEIIVGKKVPFISSQGRDINNQPINQIDREDVALTLRVKPQINSSDELTMDIFEEIQDIIPGADVATFGPTTSKRSAKTTALVKNGQTITIGGLISDRIDKSISKVPLLGDIPLLGWLFRNKSDTKSRLSLVMYLTPTIIRSPEDMEAVTLRKNLERKDFLQKNQAEEHPGIVNYGLNKELKAPSTPTPPDSPSSGFLTDKPKK